MFTNTASRIDERCSFFLPRREQELPADRTMLRRGKNGGTYGTVCEPADGDSGGRWNDTKRGDVGEQVTPRHIFIERLWDGFHERAL